MANPKRGTALLRRTAKEAKAYRSVRRIIPSIMTLIAIFVVIVYVISIMYTKFGGFTVSVNKYHQLKYGLSLSETSDFAKPSMRLNCNAVAEITNIDGRTLDDLNLGAVDGEDNGLNYLCYTFYCKNSGDAILSYEYVIDISSTSMEAEKAVRVRVMTTRNETEHVKTDYAYPAGVEDGVPIPEEGTTPFYEKNTVCRQEFENVAPGDSIKFTVVVWFEGTDLDCVDDIIGGEFKINMRLSVTGVSDLTEK